VAEYVQVITTVDSQETAASIAETVVSARLAACAQVAGPITSAYWWEGEVATATEWLVIMKTRQIRYDALAELLQQIHPYDVPEILAVPVVAGNSAYLAWIDRETAPGSA